MVITDDDAKVINDRIVLAATRMFAVDVSSFKYFLGLVAQDGLKGFNPAEPSDDGVRAQRARYLDLTYKKFHNKENAKVAAECKNNVNSFFEILKEARWRKKESLIILTELSTSTRLLLTARLVN